jgi:hypothetical protein
LTFAEIQLKTIELFEKFKADIVRNLW